ncbi:MAG: pyruvate formate-lyase-activating protein [Solirubrobacterales bacterium]
MTKGRIHSIESMGLLDGPGVRTVVFMQGCSIRCAYCHNPDTWSMEGGNLMESEELLHKLIKFKPYYKSSGGGVTFSGGEPLLQPEFLLEILKLCKVNNIHTAIDTAGFGFGNYNEILKYTDLVILDIKHSSEEGYKSLVSGDKKKLDEFLLALSASNSRVWIRHVVVPGLTDSKDHILKLKEIIKTIKNVDKIELLPYHTLGENKYETMGIPYPLKGLAPMDKNKTKELEILLK